ncbi:MAG: hypothetical protein QRY74_00780 [Chlamydia sp.]
MKIYVSCLPSLGKPDPTEERPLIGPDNRKRIIQNNNSKVHGKGRAAWYPAFQILKGSYHASNTKDWAQRRVEKALSTFQKNLYQPKTSYHKFLIYYQLDTELQRACQEYRRDNSNLDQLTAILNNKNIQIQDLLLEVIESYKIDKGANQNLALFIEAELDDMMYDNFFNFMKSIGDAKSSILYIYDKFSTDTSLSRGQVRDKLSMVIKNRAEEIFGFKYASWKPSQEFSKLVNELKDNGPLIIHGQFGPLYYEEAPIQSKILFEGRALFYWRPNARTRSGFNGSYSFILVGAQEIGKQQVVYYILPNDDSDPKAPEKQRIFCMSYERLTARSNIIPIDGDVRKGYALYKE